MSELHIIKPLHESTKRDYYERMIKDKPECMRIARQFGKDYFDGDRKYGYGGYVYDGRFKAVAKVLAEKYNLNSKSKILDFGCGKGFLMHDLNELLGCECEGFEISRYAIENALVNLKITNKLPDPDKDFDLIISLGVLHNFRLMLLKKVFNLFKLFSKHQFITLDSYHNSQELFNLQCWSLTCQSFFTPDEWIFLFKEWGYTGDYEFLFFE
jgi:SAM-dependent methyltransferase